LWPGKKIEKVCFCRIIDKKLLAVSNWPFAKNGPAAKIVPKNIGKQKP
jgi:hypothetical protein